MLVHAGKTGVTLIAEQLQDPRAALEALLSSPADRDAFDLVRAIDALADAIGPAAAEHLLEREPELQDIRPTLRDEFNTYVVGIERSDTQRLLDAEIPAPVSFRTLATPNALGMFNRLAGLAAHVAKPDMRRIVMVGCGWRPVTMFHLHETTDAREVIGLDVVPDAVETAATLARKLGYDRMRMELCDGVSFDYAGADLVYVASMVSPKRAVIARILETAPEDVRIVLWEPISLGRLWLESSEPDRHPQLEITGRGPVVRLSQDVFARRRRPAADCAT